jgi:hypothetical protein
VDDKTFNEKVKFCLLTFKLIDVIAALYKEKGKKRAMLEESLDLISKLMRNISEQPNEEKFRSFKKVS